jgi:hypothetical protein
MDAKTKNLIKVAGVHTATGVAGVSSVVTGIMSCTSAGSKTKKVFGGLAIAAGLADIAVTGISAYQKIKGGNTLIDISTKK